MPEHDPSHDTAEFPLGEVTPAELMKAVFPLVVQSATQSAAAATAAAEQGRSIEQTLNTFKSEIKSAIYRNTEAVNRLAAAQEDKNRLLEAQAAAAKKEKEDQAALARQEKENQAASTKQWHESLRTTMSSPVVLQLLQIFILLGAALGLWSQLPTQPPVSTNDTPAATLSEAGRGGVSPPGPAKPTPNGVGNATP